MSSEDYIGNFTELEFVGNFILFYINIMTSFISLLKPLQTMQLYLLPMFEGLLKILNTLQK